MANERVIVTDANDFLGPATVDRFTRNGAKVTSITELLRSRDTEV